MQILTHGPEKRYAKALVELLSAGSKKDIDSVKTVLTVLSETSDVQAFLNDDSKSRDDKAKALAALAKGVKATDTVANFMAVMAENSRAGFVRTTLRLALALVDKNEGRIVAEVRTAETLTKTQKDALVQFVKDEHKEASDIVVEEVVDPSVIAGVILTVGSKQYDNSLKGSLSSFAQNLKNK